MLYITHIILLLSLAVMDYHVLDQLAPEVKAAVLMPVVWGAVKMYQPIVQLMDAPTTAHLGKFAATRLTVLLPVHPSDRQQSQEDATIAVT